jgi:hypothetical protein
MEAPGDSTRASSLTIFGSTLAQLLDSENRLGADLPVWIDFACKALVYKGSSLFASSFPATTAAAVAHFVNFIAFYGFLPYISMNHTPILTVKI